MATGRRTFGEGLRRRIGVASARAIAAESRAATTRTACGEASTESAEGGVARDSAKLSAEFRFGWWGGGGVPPPPGGGCIPGPTS